MKRFAIRSLAAGCLAVAVGPAFATASSSVSLGNLVITLTDLKPDDGVPPWLSFWPSSLPAVHNEIKSFGDTFEDKITDNHAAAPNRDGLLSTSLHSDWATINSSVTTAANVLGFTAMSLQGTAKSGQDEFGAYVSNIDNHSGYRAFTVSPNTQVTFSFKAELQTQTSMGYNLDADMDEAALASCMLQLSWELGGGSSSDSVTQKQELQSDFYINDDNTVSGVSKSWSGEMSVGFSNTEDTAAFAWLQGYTSIQGYSAVWDGVTPAPVPEPATYAMMLGGLALVGAARRRQRRA